MNILLKHKNQRFCQSLVLLTTVIGAQLVDAQLTDSLLPETPEDIPWVSALHADHPLIGRVWSNIDQRFLTHDELLKQMAEANILLLGEKHDNPDHHRLRLGILESLLSADSVKLMVMEMLTQAQQPAIDALTAREPLPAVDQWPHQLNWDQAWHWEFYQPALGLALQTQTRLLAGNISTEAMMAIYRSDTPPPQILLPSQLAILSEEIEISHCGMLPESQIPAMVRVQQARDQQMAEALMSAGDYEQRILLAGNYHIRHDVSVPNYLFSSMLLSGTTGKSELLNMAFLEVDPTLTQPQHYLPGTNLAEAGSRYIYDLIWFTPAIRADDYCADMSR